MQTIQEKINHLNSLILKGKALDGFELYYDDAVVMQENESAPRSEKMQTARGKSNSSTVSSSSEVPPLKKWP